MISLSARQLALRRFVQNARQQRKPAAPRKPAPKPAARRSPKVAAKVAAGAGAAARRRLLSTSYAQLGQDERAAVVFAGKRGGYFVEVGAHDGVALSNTLALERELGWRGACVEPIPSAFEACVRNRPGAVCSGRPLLDRSGVEVEFSLWTLKSGITDFINRHEEAKGGEKLTLVTETLTEVLDRSGAPEDIDYLSLDTEGSELAILRGVDWGRYRFKLIHVEHNYVEPNRTQIRDFLAERGYDRTDSVRFDDEYTRRDFVEAARANLARR